MKKYIFIIVAILVAGRASAQDDITKQLEVTKAYTPKVGQAAKLTIEPNMVDTVRLRPESRYQITPTAWATTFGSQRFAPAEISTASFTRHRSLYVRAGLGVPFQTTADIYFTPRMRPGSTFGFFLNHRGSWSKIKNELGIKAPANETLNSVGVFGSKQWRRYTLDGDLTYENRLYTPYGVAIDLPSVISEPGQETATPQPYYFKGYRFDLGHLHGRFAFGDTFTDLSKFNFRFMFGGGITHWDEDVMQGYFEEGLRMGQMFGKNGFDVEFYGKTSISGWYLDTALALSPHYVLSLPKFSLRAGVDMLLLPSSWREKILFAPLPHLEVSYDAAGGAFVPWLKADHRLLDASFEGISRRNPYATGYENPTGYAYDMRFGFSGDPGGVFNYSLSGGVSRLRDYSALLAQTRSSGRATDDGSPGTVFDEVSFYPVEGDGWMFTAGAELGLHGLGGFSAKFSANWYSYRFDHAPMRTGLPPFDVGVDISYSHHDKFKILAGAKLLGRRDFYDANYDWSYSVVSRPAAVDVSLGAEVKVARDFWVFLEGRNLANQALYPYDHYRGLGAGVMAGIKAVF